MDHVEAHFLIADQMDQNLQRTLRHLDVRVSQVGDNQFHHWTRNRIPAIAIGERDVQRVQSICQSGAGGGGDQFGHCRNAILIQKLSNERQVLRCREGGRRMRFSVHTRIHTLLDIYVRGRAPIYRNVYTSTHTHAYTYIHTPPPHTLPTQPHTRARAELHIRTSTFGHTTHNWMLSQSHDHTGTLSTPLLIHPHARERPDLANETVLAKQHSKRKCLPRVSLCRDRRWPSSAHQPCR
jgi:hypothetical protein